MRPIAYWLNMAFIFSIPWENAVHLGGLGRWFAGPCHIGRGALQRRCRVARVLLVPAGVAAGERSSGQAVGQDREPDGQVDRE